MVPARREFLSWPADPAATRKRVMRTALNEIVVRKERPVINLVLHWKRRDHTALQVTLRPNAAGRHHWPSAEDTVALVRELARLMPDRQIARLLNSSGKSAGYGNGWAEQRVRGFRNHHGIAVYRDGEWDGSHPPSEAVRASLEVADIFRIAGPSYRAGHLSLQQLKVMSAIEHCRTAAPGGHLEACEDCGHWRVACAL